MQPSDAFDASKRNSGGIVETYVQTYDHVLSTQNMKESILRIDVSDASRRAFFGLHLRVVRSGIDMSAEWYAWTVLWCSGLIVDKSRPALVSLFFIFLTRLVYVCLCVQICLSRFMCSSNSICKSSIDTMSEYPLSFQNISQDFSLLSFFGSWVSCECQKELSLCWQSSVLLCLGKTLLGVSCFYRLVKPERWPHWPPM